MNNSNIKNTYSKHLIFILIKLIDFFALGEKGK